MPKNDSSKQPQPISEDGKAEMKTFELMRECLPLREDKQRVQRLLRLKSESSIYKWCEDPDGSGRPNPLDMLDVVVEHARAHYPTAAARVVDYLQSGNTRSFARAAVAGRDINQLVADIQPETEREALEAVQALSGALRSVVLRGGIEDPRRVLAEVEEAMSAFRVAAVMLQAAIQAQEAKDA